MRPHTRKAAAPRVCVIGPELSGKTALAHALAEHFNTVYVPEYARIYSLEKDAVHGSSWWPEEFVHMARTQARFEAEAQKMSGDVTICDTDAFSIWVWHRYYARECVPALREACDEDPADLYLLVSSAGPTGPLSPDGVVLQEVALRDYRRELEATGRRYVEVSGDFDERLAQSIAAIEGFLAH